ncbi:MAG: hypothetical protein IH608_03110, partial [Proteobacteria bacterium]|nr:hypothetical protein [Pseudomonadota bacterium]
MLRVFIPFLFLVFAATAGQAGWLTDSLKGALQNTAKKMAHEAADDAVDTAQSQKDRALEGDDSKPSPVASPEQRPLSQEDFVPGSKVLFFDDFTEAVVGELPRKWAGKGPGAGGTPAAVVEFQGRRFLAQRPVGRGEPTGWSQLFLQLPGRGDLPDRFTFEFEAMMSPTNAGYAPTYAVHFLSDGDYPRDAGEVGTLAFSAMEAASANGRATLSCADGRLHRIGIAVDGTEVTAFVDGVRATTDPRAITRPVRYVGLGMGKGYGGQKIMVTGLRLAEGGGVGGRTPTRGASARTTP